MVESLQQIWQRCRLFSVMDICSPLWRGNKEVEGSRRENYTVSTELPGSFFFFFFSYKEYLLKKRQTSFKSFAQIPNLIWTFLEICRLFWALLLHSMPDFPETGHSLLPGAAPSLCPALPRTWPPEQLPAGLPHLHFHLPLCLSSASCHPSWRPPTRPQVLESKQSCTKK